MVAKYGPGFSDFGCNSVKLLVGSIARAQSASFSSAAEKALRRDRLETRLPLAFRPLRGACGGPKCWRILSNHEGSPYLLSPPDIKKPRAAGLFYIWRRERDSNPRYVSVYTLSRRAPSTTRTSLLNRAGRLQDRAYARNIPPPSDTVFAQGRICGTIWYSSAKL